MDVTYAVVAKGRQGGRGGGGPPARGPSPHEAGPAPPPAPPPGPAPQGDDAYEVVTPPPEPGSPAPLGFNFRIGKPKGPREPPPDWARL